MVTFITVVQVVYFKTIFDDMIFDIIALWILWLINGFKGKPDDYANNKRSLFVINFFLIGIVLYFIYYSANKRYDERLEQEKFREDIRRKYSYLNN